MEVQEYCDLALYINGRWLKGEGRGQEPVVNPCDGGVIGYLPHASADDIESALAGAQKGFQIWRTTPAVERAKVMLRAVEFIHQRVDIIAPIIAAEQGKPLAEARGEVNRAAGMIQYCAEEGRRAYGRLIPAREANLETMVIVEPVGPIAGFTPWNFPAISPARKIGGALAAGCSLILKPSEETPGTAIELVRAFADAGLPDGVLNLLFGDPASISSSLIASPIIRKLSLTGSVPVGKLLAQHAAKVMKPASMELGGHAPVIVCEDADIPAAARMCVTAKFRNAGQICVSPTRFLVHREGYEHFSELFSEMASGIRVGSVNDPTNEMGPLINSRRRVAVDELVQDAVSKGARLLTGGRYIGEEGYFYAPTVLADVPDDARALREEPFGPLALIRPFDDFDQALSEANSLPFGLAAYAFTKSAKIAYRLKSDLECGMLGINRFAVSEPETPFGGVKESGYGREGGEEGLMHYMTTKLVSHSL